MTDTIAELERTPPPPTDDAIEMAWNVSSMVEALHDMVFAIHSLEDPAFSHDALSDTGKLHEYVHAMLRLLPSTAAITAERARSADLVEAARNVIHRHDASALDPDDRLKEAAEIEALGDLRQAVAALTTQSGDDTDHPKQGDE